MEVVLSILIPICVTTLIIVRWATRPPRDPMLIRQLELQALQRMPNQGYRYEIDEYNRAVLAYFAKHYPGGEDGP